MRIFSASNMKLSIVSFSWKKKDRNEKKIEKIEKITW